MFTTDQVNLYNRNIFKTSLYIYIFQDEKCRLMRNLSLSMNINTIDELRGHKVVQVMWHKFKLLRKIPKFIYNTAFWEKNTDI